MDTTLTPTLALGKNKPATDAEPTARQKRFAAINVGGGAALFGIAAAMLIAGAEAAGTGMPWEAPLTAILSSIEGPVAKIMAVLVITMTGLTLAFGETSGGFRKLIQIVFGLSIAFAATSFFLSFFSFGGGALI